MRVWGVAVVVSLGGCPEPAADRMVHIQDESHDFWIDAFEHPNRQGTRPTHGVTLAEAEAACAEAGKRLCTAQEWRRACAGPEGLRFGYADRLIPNICRVGVEGVAHTSLVQGRAPNEAERTGEGTAAAAGSYMDCVTPEGVHDLVGNVEEWVSDDWNGRRGSLEGGAWYTHTRYADCSGRYSRQPDYRLDDALPVASAGFRCCQGDAPPDPRADADAQRGVSRDDVAYNPAAEVVVGGVAMDRFEYPNRPGGRPLTGVTQEEAEARCDDAGKRLCTTLEWERACGGQDRPYPYGAVYVASACAVALEAGPHSGAHFACATPEGVQDLVGSVWEWTATEIVEPGLGATQRAEVRGGSWQTDGEKSVCRPRDGYPFPRADARHGDLGFRCCRTVATAAPAPHAQPAPPDAPGGCCPPGLVFTEGVCMAPFELSDGPETAPMTGLGLAEATAQCMARGLRLCSESEWTRVCEGAGSRRWPYGNAYTSGRCHHRAYAEGDAVEPWTEASGSGCVTPDGISNLSGNLWEWVATDSGGVLRGGGWDLSAGLGQCRVRATPPADQPPASAGVRCCGTPSAEHCVQAPG